MGLRKIPHSARTATGNAKKKNSPDYQLKNIFKISHKKLQSNLLKIGSNFNLHMIRKN